MCVCETPLNRNMKHRSLQRSSDGSVGVAVTVNANLFSRDLWENPKIVPSGPFYDRNKAQTPSTSGLQAL